MIDASAKHNNEKSTHCAKTSDIKLMVRVMCEPIKATEEEKTSERQHAVEGLASRCKATKHLGWLPCLKAPHKYC